MNQHSLSKIVSLFVSLLLLGIDGKADVAMSPQQVNLIEQCRHFDKDACMAVVPQLRFQKSPVAGELAVGFCLNRGEMCGGALEMGPPAERQRIVAHMNKVCFETGSEICSDLAGYYENGPDFKKAIAAAKKQFAKSKTGIYPLFEYKHGDKEKAVKAMKLICQHDNHECGFYLVNIKKNKSTPTLLDGTIANCKSLKQESYGSDSCVLAALYLYRQEEHDQAIEVLMNSCELGNTVSCAYIIGLPPPPGPLQAKALRFYCGVDREIAPNSRKPWYNGDPLLSCKGVTADTETISSDNIHIAWEELKKLDKTFRDPI